MNDPTPYAEPPTRGQLVVGLVVLYGWAVILTTAAITITRGALQWLIQLT